MDDDGVRGEPADLSADRGDALLALYDTALADVYGYLLRRCGSAATAEDLASETFTSADPTDDWDTLLDSFLAHDVLATLAPQHRSALTLRYLDGLPVADVARHLSRTLGATEVLLVRSKRAFRQRYQAIADRKEDES